MNLIAQLNWRYATKAFDPTQKLSPEQWADVREALRLSPSSYGLQPYKFVVVENPELRAQLLPHAYNQTQVTEASHLLVLCRLATIDAAYVEKFIGLIARTRGVDSTSLTEYKNMMLGFVAGLNEEQKAVWMDKQVYLALGNLLTICAVLGIDATPMEGFVAPQFDAVLDLPAKGLHATVVCTLGTRSPTDRYAQAKKVRFSAEDLFVMI